MAMFTLAERRRLVREHQAMPDGSYPIRNVADLRNAIHAYGRAKNKAAVKAWIMKRARQLHAEKYLPADWT